MAGTSRMPDRERDTAAIRQEIADGLLAIHVDSYGGGAERVNVEISDDAVVVFMDGIELARSEQFLLDSGDPNAVIELRSRYQQAIESTFRAVVERATGRRVVSFASVTKLDPNYVVEIFRLG